MSRESAKPLICRRTFVTLAAAAAAAAAPALAALAVPGAPQGRIETLAPLGSADHPEPRVRVWLPPGYEDGARSYRTSTCSMGSTHLPAMPRA